VPAHQPIDHAAPQDPRAERPDPLPAHARTVRVLLRQPARVALFLDRQGLVLAGNLGGLSYPPLLHHGLDRLFAHDAAGADVVLSRDPLPWRKAMAVAAPARIRQRDRWRGPLLLAGKSRSARSADLCCDCHGFARLPPSRVCATAISSHVACNLFRSPQRFLRRRFTSGQNSSNALLAILLRKLKPMRTHVLPGPVLLSGRHVLERKLEPAYAPKRA